MTKKEVETYIEEYIARQCDESDLVREEVIDVVPTLIVYNYYNDIFTLQETLHAFDYIGYEVDLSILVQGKKQHDENKQKRKLAAERRKAFH